MTKIMSTVAAKPKTSIAFALAAAGIAIAGALFKRSRALAINDDDAQAAAA
jgi:hypothetical protein